MKSVWRNSQKIAILAAGAMFVLSLAATGAEVVGIDLGHLLPLTMTIGLAVCLLGLALSQSAQVRETHQLLAWISAVSQGNLSGPSLDLRTPRLEPVSTALNDLLKALRQDLEETLPRVGDADFEQSNRGLLRRPLSRLHQKLHARSYTEQLARADALAKSANVKVVARAIEHGATRSMTLIREGLTQVEKRQRSRAGQFPQLMELEASLVRIARRLPSMEAPSGIEDLSDQLDLLVSLAHQFKQLAQNATVEAVRLGRQGDGVQRVANSAGRLSEVLLAAVKRLRSTAEATLCSADSLKGANESLGLVRDYIGTLKVAQRDETACDKALSSSLKQLEASIRHGAGLGRQLSAAVMSEVGVAQSSERPMPSDASERHDDRTSDNDRVQTYVVDNTRFRRDKPAVGGGKQQGDGDVPGGRTGQPQVVELSLYRAQSDQE